ncbi:MAG: acyltransferase family protein [Candidatus Thorarchaeota archaeon]
MSEQDSIIGKGFSQGANILKGFVGYGVVPVHWYYGLFLIPFNILSYNVFTVFFLEISKFGFEAMMFLSGMFLTMGVFREKLSEIHSWKRWYHKRLVRLYPNLIILTLVNLYFFFFLFGKKYNMNTILLCLSGLQSVPINPHFWGIVSHFWFFTLMLSCYLFFPFFYYLIKKRFKLMIVLSIILYISFIIFYDVYNSIAQYIMYEWFGHELNLWWLNLLTPRYFSFFFGMLYGFWICQNDIRNRNIFQKKTKIKIVLFVSVIVLSLIHLYFLSFLLPRGTSGYFTQNIMYSNLARTFTFPSMGVLLAILTLMTFNKKPRVPRIIELPGEEVYEIILSHSIPLGLNTYIILNIAGITKVDVWYISFPLLFITSFLLAYPFYRFGKWVKTKKNIQSIIIIIAISLLTYGVIANLLNFFHVPELNDMASIIAFDSILISVVVISIFYLKYRYRNLSSITNFKEMFKKYSKDKIYKSNPN